MKARSPFANRGALVLKDVAGRLCFYLLPRGHSLEFSRAGPGVGSPLTRHRIRAGEPGFPDLEGEQVARCYGGVYSIED
jgi:hypothetical protein